MNSSGWLLTFLAWWLGRISGGSSSRASCKDVVIAVVDYTSRAAKLAFILGRQSQQDVLLQLLQLLLHRILLVFKGIMCVPAFGECARGTRSSCIHIHIHSHINIHIHGHR